MNELIQAYTPQILDFMVLAILLCGLAMGLAKGLYKKLMPLAVIAAAAVCGLTLSAILTGPITAWAVPALTQATMGHYDYALLTVNEYDAILARLETGMTDEVREAIDLARYNAAAHEAAHDAGNALATVNDEVLTDENIDAVVSGVEGAADRFLAEAAREAIAEKGLTGDAARQYIREAGNALGSAKDTVLTDENIDAAMDAAQKELSGGAEYFLGDGSEAKAGRDAARAAGDKRAATEAAVSALIGFLTPRYVRVVVFFIGWVAFLAILTTIKNTFGLAFDFPVVKQVDRLGGAALGFVEAAVCLWGILWLTRYLGFNVFRELSKGTILLRFFA